MIELLKDLEQFTTYDTDSFDYANLEKNIAKKQVENYTCSMSVHFMEYDNKSYPYHEIEFNSYAIMMHSNLYRYIKKIHDEKCDINIHIVDPYSIDADSFRVISLFDETTIDESLKQINNNIHDLQDEYLEDNDFIDDPEQHLFMVFESSDISVINNIKILAR